MRSSVIARRCLRVSEFVVNVLPPRARLLPPVLPPGYSLQSCKRRLRRADRGPGHRDRIAMRLQARHARLPAEAKRAHLSG